MEDVIFAVASAIGEAWIQINTWVKQYIKKEEVSTSISEIFTLVST
jgi:hypothetical protein